MAFRDLKTTTIREFDGGLNVVNDDLNMDKKYSTIETNVYYSNQGNKAKRFGTKFLKDLTKFDIVTEQYKIKEQNEKKLLTLFYNKNLYPQVGDRVFVDVTYSTQSTSRVLYGEVSAIYNDKIKIKQNYTITNGTIIKYLVETKEILDDFYELSLEKDENVTYSQNEFKYIEPKTFKTGDKIVIKECLLDVLKDKILEINEQEFDKNTKIQKLFVDVSEYIDIELRDYTSTYNNTQYHKENEETLIRYSGYSNKENNSWISLQGIMRYYTTLEHFNNNSDLIVGHKINYNNNEYILQDVQTEYASDENNVNYLAVYYKFNINVNQEDINNGYITITHDNRNIKGSKIVNCEYFLDKIIAVSDIGEVVMIDTEQNASIIWNDDIAYTLNKEYDIQPWSNVEDVCFAVFNGSLTLWNGKDKPLEIILNDTTTYRPCNFLFDLGTGSNANVPRAKYAIGFNHYLVCANIIEDDGTIYEDKVSISMRNSGGTFFDPSQKSTVLTGNDAVEVNLGTIITTNEQKITGLFRYRDKLVIGFKDVTVLGTLGTYEQVVGEEEGIKNHVPNFEDVINDTGCLSNKSYKSIGNEVVCIDFSGVPMFQRTGLYSIVQPARISNLIKPEIYPKFDGLTENQIENNIFSIHNPKENQYMLFIPTKFDENGNQIETVCYVYTIDNKIKATTLGGSWSKFIGWNFQCGCTSALKNVFLFDKTKLYLLGNSDNPFYADFIDDPDYPDENGELTGKEIEFEWEFPWADFGDRSATKHSRYLAISSTGNSDFSIDFFTDYIYYNNYYKKLDPSLTLNFLAGDSHGWGNGKQSYGGGRITNTEQLFAWTTKFKIAKFRIHGASKDKLNINSITLYYQMGNIRR